MATSYGYELATNFAETLSWLHGTAGKTSAQKAALSVVKKRKIEIRRAPENTSPRRSPVGRRPLAEVGGRVTPPVSFGASEGEAMASRAERVTFCAVCGRQYVATRSDSRYCSSTCRSRAHRSRRVWVPITPSDMQDLASQQPDIVEVIQKCRVSSNDFARIAACGPVQVRAGARRVSEGIAAALEVEGW